MFLSSAVDSKHVDATRNSDMLFQKNKPVCLTLYLSALHPLFLAMSPENKTSEENFLTLSVIMEQSKSK